MAKHRRLVRGSAWGAQGKNGAFASKGTALSGARVRDSTTKVDGLGYKSLIGIPWRVAFGLMDDGWTLRSEIIWHKPNPLPESVRDRPTKSHEHLFLFSKSEVYYYNADAIAERATEARVRAPRAQRKHGESDPRFQTRKNLPAVEPRDVRNARDVWTIDEDEFEQFMAWKEDCERDASDVWKLATQRYSGAHFAAMPPRLAERCIKAGSRFGDRVLDPFFGSGTVGKECDVLGRLWYGCEIQSDYAPLIAERTVQSGLVPQGES
jgi:DNA modification methylase